MSPAALIDDIRSEIVHRFVAIALFCFQGIEFDAETGEGVIIVNWGTVSTARITILMAGSQPYQEAQAIELEARL